MTGSDSRPQVDGDQVCVACGSVEERVVIFVHIRPLAGFTTHVPMSILFFETLLFLGVSSGLRGVSVSLPCAASTMLVSHPRLEYPQTAQVTRGLLGPPNVDPLYAKYLLVGGGPAAGYFLHYFLQQPTASPEAGEALPEKETRGPGRAAASERAWKGSARAGVEPTRELTGADEGQLSGAAIEAPATQNPSGRRDSGDGIQQADLPRDSVAKVTVGDRSAAPPRHGPGQRTAAPHAPTGKPAGGRGLENKGASEASRVPSFSTRNASSTGFAEVSPFRVPDGGVEILMVSAEGDLPYERPALSKVSRPPTHGNCKLW